VPTSEQTAKETTHTLKYYSALKMKAILPFEKTQMSLENIMLNLISLMQKNNSCMISTYM
jgi:hypothetical protein